MLMRQLTAAASAPAALAFVVLAGCNAAPSGANAPFDTDSADTDLARAALESPILSCQDDRRQCVADAARDVSARQACDATFASCLQTAADKAQATAKALQACRDDGLKCVRNGGKQSECRTDYNSCTKAAIDNASGDDSDDSDGGSPSADADASAPVLSTLDGGASTPVLQPPTGPLQGGGFPGGPGQLPPPGGFPLPTLQLDGGLLADLPPAEKCLVELRICAFTHPASAQDCATTAQSCLAAAN